MYLTMMTLFSGYIWWKEFPPHNTAFVNIYCDFLQHKPSIKTTYDHNLSSLLQIKTRIIYDGGKESGERGILELEWFNE